MEMACVLTICKIFLHSQVFEHEQTSARPFYFTIHHTTYVSHLDLDLDKLSAYLENGYRNKRAKQCSRYLPQEKACSKLS